MNNIEKLQEKIALLNVEVTGYFVIVKEDEFSNTGDPNLYEISPFVTLNEAMEKYVSEIETITTLETSSEFKNVELGVLGNGDHIEIESESYVKKYEVEDYGKYLLSYMPTNNGISGIKTVVIDEKTPFFVSTDHKFSVKFLVLESKSDVILEIYNKSLYISMEDAEELFDLSI